MPAILTFLNLVSKISSLGIFTKFFDKNPKTGASAGATIALTVVTNLFGYLGIGITEAQALEISEGIVAVGGALMIHFTPSPMKGK
jgi:hypothetical protein